ncbi:DUF2225 domain-containing protein [Peptostreptococcaceae bacterium AGR-M142]
MIRKVDSLFDREITCPACKQNFMTKIMRKSSSMVVKRDLDFCNHYKGENPYFYGIWICPFCGYAATEGRFLKLKKEKVVIIREKITSLWFQRNYGGKRELDDAISIYKLALYQGKILNYESSYLANLALKLAWFYRYKGIEKKEMEFTKHALELYTNAFSNEKFPITGMNPPVLAYILGVLNFKFKDYRLAIKWLEKSVNDPESYKQVHIVKMARNLWQDISDEYRNQKNKENEESKENV